MSENLRGVFFWLTLYASATIIYYYKDRAQGTLKTLENSTKKNSTLSL